MKQSDVEVAVKIVNATIKGIHCGEFDLMTNSNIVVDEPHAMSMRIIKRPHYAKGQKNGFAVSVNLSTNSEFFEPEFINTLNKSMFIGWSLCDGEDRFNKTTGTKIAVVRALKIMKGWLKMNLFNPAQTEIPIIIDGTKYNGSNIYVTRYASITEFVDQVAIASSIYRGRNGKQSLLNDIILNSMRFIKDVEVIFVNSYELVSVNALR